ncbi:MAG: hypothetical protein VB051_05635 [Candidatus Pelethousia sp.]|nr:hypothetical protein [Candidatus Pelethousia sp.]
MIELFGLALALFLVIGPVWLVFKLVFFAMKSAFRVAFWVVQGVIFLLGFLFSGGLIAFLGIFFLLNIFALPVIFLCSKR